jgi:predicted nucleic acid-binding protein
MNDNYPVFLDTNIIVYAFSETELEKQSIARNILLKNNTVISTQVLQELANTLIRKFKVEYLTVTKNIRECIQNCNTVHLNDKNTILRACRIGDSYHFSFYDSLIISAALETKCKTLYSEDFQHNQIIETSLTIVNPFN